jgi:hypothetical protein
VASPNSSLAIDCPITAGVSVQGRAPEFMSEKISPWPERGRKPLILSAFGSCWFIIGVLRGHQRGRERVRRSAGLGPVEESNSTRLRPWT